MHTQFKWRHFQSDVILWVDMLNIRSRQLKPQLQSGERQSRLTT